MHDIVEGVLPLAIKHLLKYIVDDKPISVYNINKWIDKFEFGSAEVANKPRAICQQNVVPGEVPTIAVWRFGPGVR